MKSAANKEAGARYTSRGLDQTPRVEQRHPVGDRHRLFLVVGDVQRQDAELALNPADFRAHLDPELGVEVGERFVQQQHRGAVDQRAGDRHALLLAARERGGLARSERVEPECPQHLVHAPADFGPGHAARSQAVGRVLEHAEMREQRVGLEHHADVALLRRHARVVAAVEGDRPAGNRLEPRDHPQRGGLAAARGAEHGEKLAPCHVEADPVDRRDRVGRRAEGLGQVADRQHGEDRTAVRKAGGRPGIPDLPPSGTQLQGYLAEKILSNFSRFAVRSFAAPTVS
jgi:hypothetical protein